MLGYLPVVDVGKCLTVRYLPRSGQATTLGKEENTRLMFVIILIQCTPSRLSPRQKKPIVRVFSDSQNTVRGGHLGSGPGCKAVLTYLTL